MNLHGWLLEDDGAHLADSKRENSSLSLISDGTNDLGDPPTYYNIINFKCHASWPFALLGLSRIIFILLVFNI